MTFKIGVKSFLRDHSYIYASAFVPVILQLKLIFHKGFHSIITRSYVPWTQLNTNICALFHQYIEYFQPAPQNWCRANGSVAFCVLKLIYSEKATKRSIFQTSRKTHRDRTIHLRRRQVLGGEGCLPLPTFADARGEGSKECRRHQFLT